MLDLWQPVHLDWRRLRQRHILLSRGFGIESEKQAGASQATSLYEGAPIHGWLRVKKQTLSLRHRPSSLQLLFHHRDNRASTGYTCASHRHRGHFHHAEMDKNVSTSAPGDGNNVWIPRLLKRASAAL